MRRTDNRRRGCVVAIAATLLIGGCTDNDATSNVGAGTNAASAVAPTGSPNAALSTSAAKLGFAFPALASPVPALEFAGGNGETIGLKNFRGKVVLLNLWATWCGPCRKEMPTLDRLQARLGGTEFEVVALSMDQAGLDVVRDFYREVGLKRLRIYIDPSAQPMFTLNLIGLPTTLLIDREGRELARLAGTKEWDSVEMVQLFRQIIERTRNK